MKKNSLLTEKTILDHPMIARINEDTPSLTAPSEDIARQVGLPLSREREIKISGSTKGLGKTLQFSNEGRVTPDQHLEESTNL